MAVKVLMSRQRHVPETELAAEPVGPRFSRPKVILIDLGEEVVQTVRAAGYLVTSGTLGRPYLMQPNDEFVRPFVSYDLPGFTEQEVVVVQHSPPEPSNNPTGRAPRVTSEPTLWASRKYGVIDTRPWAAHIFARDDVARILSYGGIAVCFCTPKMPAGLVWAIGSPGRFVVQQELDYSTWGILPPLDYFQFPRFSGEEIQPLTGKGLFAPITTHLQTATAACTIQPGYDQAQRWHAVAKNKYGSDVAGVYVPAEGNGLVVLLPQVKDPGATVQVLLDDILPVLAPKLFPESEKFAWRERPPYELREVQRLRLEIERLRSEAELREAELQAQIETTKEEHGWLLDLLSATGDELVDAVERALRELGLPDVQKVDEAKEVQQAGRLREDIQVLGGSPVMLVEVKGLNGLPKEEDTLAVAKYRAPRMEEWDRTDVRGLAVINHQRSLPPLERENVHTFQADVLENAQHQKFAAITAFDLYRLVVNKRNLGWPEEAIDPLFYENGRVVVLPRHYEFVGVVDHFYEKPGVAAISVEGSGFAVGDRLAFELPIEFKEDPVVSIQLDNVDVEQALQGQRVGVKTALTKAEARNGLRVCRVTGPS